MKYFKNIIGGYIVSISTIRGLVEIPETEYNEVLELIHNKPTAPEGFDYRLKENLEWELYELPEPEPEPEEPTLDDTLNALHIMGVD